MKITVITPVFNGEKYLEKTILSVLNQTYSNIEYIVIDGGSTDGTLSIINKYRDRLHYFISENDDGMYDAIRKGLNIATGDICAYINSDDYYLENAFETIVTIFKQNPKIKWIRGLGCVSNHNSVIIGSNRTLIKTRDDIINFKLMFTMQESTFWLKELNKVIDLNKFASFKLAGDQYLWKCFAQKEDLYVVDAILAVHRKHSGQLSLDLDSYYNELNSFTKKRTFFDLIRLKYKLIMQFFSNDKYLKRKYNGLLLTWDFKSSKFK